MKFDMVRYNKETFNYQKDTEIPKNVKKSKDKQTHVSIIFKFKTVLIHKMNRLLD